MASVRVIAQTSDMTTAEVTFSRSYHASTIITHATHIVVDWINYVYDTYAPPAGANSRISVGLHIECSPPYDTIALLQLCVRNTCLVYQLQHRNDTSPPARLNDFLNDDRFSFIGVAVELAIFRLRVGHGLRVRAPIDIGYTAARRLQRDNLRWAGLDELAWVVMGIELIRPNGAQRSALLERVVPVQLIPFACMDAIFSYELGRILLGN